MKQTIKKWALRLTATMMLIAILLLIILLNPLLTYAKKATHNSFTVFYDKTPDPAFYAQLDEATRLLKASELYSTGLQLDICLNNGSTYPKIVQAVCGQAFARGFYNKVVIQGSMNIPQHYVEVNGYRWNFTQLLAHEMIHCVQFNKLGPWGSNPLAGIPVWKWEGYAEYISRRNAGQEDLENNIARLMASGKDTWEIPFADGTIAPREYYQGWLLVQYCMDIKKMTYRQILSDTAGTFTLEQEMMGWFYRQQQQ